MEDRRKEFEDSGSGFPKFGQLEMDNEDVNDRMPFGNNQVIMPGGVRNDNPFGSNGFDAEPDEGERSSLV